MSSDFLIDLTSSDKEVLREAAFQAGDARSLEAVPLLAKLLADDNIGVQEAADSALKRIGGQETVDAVVPLLRSDDAPVRNLSMDILRKVGGQHMEGLIEMVQDDDADIRIFVADILGSTENSRAVKPLCDMLLKDPEVNVRYQAAVSLGSLGLKEAAPCLNQAMQDEEWVQYSVIEALSKLKQSSSVDALVKAMDTSSDLVGSMIVDALGNMGNVKAVKILLGRLEKSPQALRNMIVKAVIDIMGGKSLSLLSEAEREDLRIYMLAALDDDDVEIQNAAISGLGYVGGETASKAILALATELDPDRDQDRLAMVIETLSHIGMTQALADALEVGEWKQARVAVHAMELIGGPEVSQVLVDAFWDKDLELQRVIAAALAEGASEDVQPFFIYVLDRHPDGKVLKSALRFLRDKADGDQAGEMFFKLLDHEYDDVKEAALEACIEVDGPVMAERFKEMASSSEPVHRLMAAYALGRMHGDDHLEYLERALEDEVPDIRKVALESVSLQCTVSDRGRALVISRLADENREVRLAVVEIMGGCDFPEVVSHLITALSDEDDWVKIRALEALGQHRSESAVEQLLPLLEDANTMVAIKALEALGAIGGPNSFKILLEVSHGENHELAAAAETVMERMQQAEAGER